MGRFTSPRAKVCRRLGQLVFENSNVEKALMKRDSLPGGFRRKQSEYARHLIEKQKVMHYYGMRERQMRSLFQKARRQKGDTGQNFLVMCERRLDNFVFSSGFASSRAAARQLVSHGHIRLNGQKVDIPSAQINTGDVLTVADRSKSQKRVRECLESRQGYEPPEWIAVDPKSQTAKVVRLPMREDVRLPIEAQLVVEFYSR
jgi:small subunit ribosomal protein S4